jgi:hypothetical protein
LCDHKNFTLCRGSTPVADQHPEPEDASNLSPLSACHPSAMFDMTNVPDNIDNDLTADDGQFDDSSDCENEGKEIGSNNNNSENDASQSLIEQV